MSKRQISVKVEYRFEIDVEEGDDRKIIEDKAERVWAFALEMNEARGYCYDTEINVHDASFNHLKG